MTKTFPPEIIAFNMARLDEDEAAAKACPLENWEASGPPRDGRYVGPTEWYLVGRVDAHTGHLLAGGIEMHDWDHACLIHAARHDPARALRQVAAGRRILARHHDDGRGFCAGCPNGEISGDPEWEIDECPENRDLAATWADNPGYQQRWAL